MVSAYALRANPTYAQDGVQAFLIFGVTATLTISSPTQERA